MNQTEQDASLCANDSLFESTGEDRLDTKKEKPSNKKEADKCATEMYELRNFVASNSSATSQRLVSEEFENISVTHVEDIGSGKLKRQNEGSEHDSRDSELMSNIDSTDNGKVKTNEKGGDDRGLETDTETGACVNENAGGAVDNSESAERDREVSGLNEETKDGQAVEMNNEKCDKDKENKDVSFGLLEEPVSPERRVSFSLEEYMEVRENSYNMDARRASENTITDGLSTRNYRKHSSGDLHSRLKTRKLLGVGETDDGDVHRSKLSQILGHSDQLYIKLPNGLRIWQIVLSTILSIMAIWALVFPSHFFLFMYEMDGSSFTFPIRLYASALVCISVMYWSTIQASDRDLIRLVLLSSIVFFTLQALVLGINMLTDQGVMSRWTVCSMTLAAVFALIGYLYLWEVTSTRFGGLKRTTSNKDISDNKDQ